MRWQDFASRRIAASSARALLAALGGFFASPPALAVCPPPEGPQQIVERVEDARTVVLRDGTRLRLAGIEPAVDFLGEGPDPLPARLTVLLADAPITFRAVTEAPDRHSRVPALLFLASGAFLQEKLVTEGLAVAFATEADLPCFEDLRGAERIARESRAGAWRDQNPLPADRPDLVAARIGRFAILEGKILSVGTRYTATWLDFGRTWASDVTVRIARADRQKFGGEAAIEAYAGRDVMVRGYLSDSGGPLLEAGSPASVQLLATQGKEW
jgi:endonuclease YncB( thermonuclease family)